MKLSLVALTLIIFLAGATPVNAQGFSGSNVNNYYCLPRSGQAAPPVTVTANGDYICQYNGAQARAIPKPPSSKQLQIWFVRVLYVMWSVAGIIFTFVLIGIGFNYLTAFNNEVVLADVIKQFRKWLLGIGLVVLAYPLLNTFFNLLGLRDSECINELELPGFQFFFPQACVITSEDNISVMNYPAEQVMIELSK